MAQLPSYPIDLKPISKLQSPNSSRLITEQNNEELEKYINEVVEYIRTLAFSGGVDINTVIAAVRNGLKITFTIPVGMADGGAVEVVTGVILSRNGNTYTVSMLGANNTVSEIKNKSTNAVALVAKIKREQEIDFVFDTAITTDFEVTII